MTVWQIDTAMDHAGRHWCCVADPDDARWMIQSMDHVSTGEIVRVFDSAIAAWQRVPQAVQVDNGRIADFAARCLRAHHDVTIRRPAASATSRPLFAERTLRAFVDALKDQ